MDGQDKKTNSKIILTALVVLIIGILIAFYYSYAQSQSQIAFLKQEKDLLVKDLTLMKTDVDRLSALNEVNEIELESAKYRVQELIDSIGRLNFTVETLREFKTELRRLEAKNDSLKLKNDFLRYNNMVLAEKNGEIEKEKERLRKKSKALAEVKAQQQQQTEQPNKESKVKTYLKLRKAESSGFRLRLGRPIETNKASIVEKLRGCVTIAADASEAKTQKVIYLQFLSPNMRVIDDNANTISVNGNIYSKKVELLFSGEETDVCDFVTIPQGSLEKGNYRLNVFEDEKLLKTTEFELK